MATADEANASVTAETKAEVGDGQPDESGPATTEAQGLDNVPGPSASEDAAPGPLSDDQKASVRRQVSFYFCDSNLVRDVFLKKKISEHSEGYVSIALLLSFQRMKTFLNIPQTTGPDQISEALVKEVAEELRSCDNIEVNEDATLVRRKEPLGSEEEVRKTITARSLHVSNIAPESTLEDLEEFFGGHVEFNCIWMLRKGKKKTFEGEIFLDCKNVEEASKLKGMTIEFKGVPLEIKWKEEMIGKKGDASRKKEHMHNSHKGNGQKGSKKGSKGSFRGDRGKGRGRGRGGRRGGGQGGDSQRNNHNGDSGVGNEAPEADTQAVKSTGQENTGGESKSQTPEQENGGTKVKIDGEAGEVNDAKKSKQDGAPEQENRGIKRKIDGETGEDNDAKKSKQDGEPTQVPTEVMQE